MNIKGKLFLTIFAIICVTGALWYLIPIILTFNITLRIISFVLITIWYVFGGYFLLIKLVWKTSPDTIGTRPDK